MRIKKPSKKKIHENLMEKILDMVNQYAIKKFQNTKNKEHEMTQKQTKELSEDINKHQSETKDPVKREIHKLQHTL
jgi:broad-specificity NMP kinase